jgi:hypothetical protein
MRVRYTLRARRDLQAVFEFIDARSRGGARAVKGAIVNAIRRLGSQPRLAPPTDALVEVRPRMIEERSGPPTLRNFVLAFCMHWLTLMSGPLSVLVAVLGLWFAEGPYARIAFGIPGSDLRLHAPCDAVAAAEDARQRRGLCAHGLYSRAQQDYRRERRDERGDLAEGGNAEPQWVRQQVPRKALMPAHGGRWSNPPAGRRNGRAAHYRSGPTSPALRVRESILARSRSRREPGEAGIERLYSLAALMADSLSGRPNRTPFTKLVNRLDPPVAN